ncbi:MAG: glycosyltransferase family 4 protein [Planctomycetota bacterium]|nr:glycosyltransferase family 4 protein [Planctomycetota bacterium]
MRQSSVLIIEQGFLKPRGSKPVHGVELFRLHLIRQLVARGHPVALAVERSWEPRIRQWLESEHAGAAPVSIHSAAPFAGVPGTGLISTRRAAAVHPGGFDAVLFGNARLGLVPAMYYADWMNLAPRRLLFAHRDPGPNFLDAVSTLAFDVVANSAWVADWYRGNVNGSVDVLYGLAGAERFYPRPEPAPRDDDLVHFVLLGRLPNISKGQERAIAAFRALPEPLRRRCRLHLASFASPPQFDDPCIIAHPWMHADAVGDFLRRMDAMLTVSSHETFSQAIVQGMLTGLPIVATELPVFVEKLDPLPAEPDAESRARTGPERRRGGLLVRSTAEITEAIALLAENTPLRRTLGAEGRAVALARYVWDVDRFLRDHLFPRA